MTSATEKKTRGRKGEASRARILAAAKILFVERGFDETRPQDIARAAGMATSTFYLYFADKRAVFLAFATQVQNELFEDYAEALEGVEGFSNRWRSILETVFNHARTHPGVLQVAFIDPVIIDPNDELAWQTYDRFSESIKLGIQGALRGGSVYEDYDLDLISHAMAGMVRHGATHIGRRIKIETERLAQQGADEDQKEQVAQQLWQVLTDNLTHFVVRALGKVQH